MGTYWCANLRDAGGSSTAGAEGGAAVVQGVVDRSTGGQCRPMMGASRQYMPVEQAIVSIRDDAVRRLGNGSPAGRPNSRGGHLCATCS